MDKLVSKADELPDEAASELSDGLGVCPCEGCISAPVNCPGLDLCHTRMRKALERLSKLGNEPHYGNSIGNRIAQEALGIEVGVDA